MAYTAYTMDTINSLGAEYKKLKVELEKLEKAKGDKKKIAEMKKELDAKGKVIAKKLDTDIAGVAVNFKEYALKVERYLTEAQKSLNGAKTALKNFASDPNPAMFRKELEAATQPASFIKTMYDVMVEDTKDYGKSWFGYRGYNGSGPAHSLDKTVVANFNKQVGKLMNDQKQCGTKVEKIGSLAKEAEAIKNQALALAKEGLGMSKAMAEEAKRLAAGTAELLNKVVKHDKMNLTSIEGKANSIEKGLSQKKEVYGDQYRRNIESMYKDCVATHKFHVESWRSMEKMVKGAEKRMAKATDPTVAKFYQAAENDLASMKQLKEKVDAVMKKVVPNAAKVMKMCEAAAKKKK